ncbi:MAG TPA: hypothetical protein VN657_13165 [Nitrospiraceae bacterium]|jgi:hypothetical protein|nr:hypothetical protein [Nitrospiraceae bacterium]
METTRDASHALEGGAANMIFIFIAMMLLLLLGLVTLYLYNSGVFTKT